MNKQVEAAKIDTAILASTRAKSDGLHDQPWCCRRNIEPACPDTSRVPVAPTLAAQRSSDRRGHRAPGKRVPSSIYAAVAVGLPEFCGRDPARPAARRLQPTDELCGLIVSRW